MGTRPLATINVILLLYFRFATIIFKEWEAVEFNAFTLIKSTVTCFLCFEQNRYFHPFPYLCFYFLENASEYEFIFFFQNILYMLCILRYSCAPTCVSARLSQGRVTMRLIRDMFVSCDDSLVC